jgi:hypothetical protein
MSKFKITNILILAILNVYKRITGRQYNTNTVDP